MKAARQHRPNRVRRAWLACGKCLTATPHVFADTNDIRSPETGTRTATELIYECALCGRPRRWGIESDGPPID